MPQFGGASGLFRFSFAGGSVAIQGLVVLSAGVADDEFDRLHDAAAGFRQFLSVKAGKQEFSRGATKQIWGLPDDGDGRPDDIGHLKVVETDEGDVVGHFHVQRG